MTATEYISMQDPARKKILSAIHEVVLSTNKKVECHVAPMMGKDMIQYTCKGFFHYALASVKDHMSLHLMPIYGSHELHEKYSKLLSKAKFQKGCINFTTEEQMPIAIVKKLMIDCSKIDLVAMLDKKTRPMATKEWIEKNKKR